MNIRDLVFLICLAFPATTIAAPPGHANSHAFPDETDSAKFADYFLKPSATGQLGERNVIVWAQSNSQCYVARVYFENTASVQVNTPSGSVVPDRVFVWQMVCGGGGSPDYVLEYIYATPATGFTDALGVQIREDVNGDGAFEFDNAYGYRHTFTSTPLGRFELVNSVETYEDPSGTHLTDNNWARLMSAHGEPVTVNDLTFNDVAVTSFLGFNRIRFLAKGIGAVREVNGNMIADPRFGGQSSRDAIFYRANGNVAGSVANTPFAGVVVPWFLAP